MNASLLRLLPLIVALGLVHTSAQAQGWHRWFDSEKPGPLVRLLGGPDGGLRLVSHLDTVAPWNNTPFPPRITYGSRFVDWTGQGLGRTHFEWGEPQDQCYQPTNETYWSLGIDNGFCGTPPHLYHFNETDHRTGERHYGMMVYRHHYSYRDGADPCRDGAFSGYHPCVDLDRLWPGALNEARAFVRHPNGRRYLALMDEVLVETDTAISNVPHGRHYRHLIDLRTSLIFDLAAPNDSTLILATSAGILRMGLDGRVRDALLTGTPIRRLRALLGGWIAETLSGLLRLDDAFAPVASLEPSAGEQLRDWTWGPAGGLALTGTATGARLLHFDADLHAQTEDLPAEVADARHVGWLDRQAVLAGSWTMPATEAGTTRPFSWLARRGRADAPADVALLELRAEHVQRRERDFTFDLLARVANRSSRPLAHFGARVNRPTHDGRTGHWSYVAAHQPLLASQAEGCIRLGRFAAAFDDGSAPSELAARVCVEIELPNAQRDAQPADNSSCTTLRLTTTSRTGGSGFDGVWLYPNPAGERVAVESEAPGFSLRVFDLTGRRIWNGATPDTRLELPASEWPAGLYQVAIETAGGVPHRLPLLVPAR